VYRNEAEVGLALQQSNVPREEIFVTTKIPPTEQGEVAAYDAVLSSLRQLAVDYIDLVLIHWPGKAKTPLDSPANQEARRGSWRALIRAQREGMVRDIGVSNFTVAHLQDLCFQAPASAADRDSCALPAVNQVECHPLCVQRELRALCADRGIALQAYSPLCCGDAEVYGHPQMQALLASVREASAGAVCTPPQLLLLWGLQQGLSVIPKSASRVRLQENWAFMQRVLHDMAPVEAPPGARIGDEDIACEGQTLALPVLPVLPVLPALPVLPEDCLAGLRGSGGEDRHLCWDPRKVL